MPFEKKLVAHTPEGINVQPLYRREDAVARLLTAAPGETPYLRGARRPDERGRRWEASTEPSEHEFSPLPALALALTHPGKDAPVPADPLGWLASHGSLPMPLALCFDDVAEGMREAEKAGLSTRVVGIGAHLWHESGATAVQELAFALATGAEYWRQLLDRAVAPAKIAAHTHLGFAVGVDFFMEIAKLRAARVLWAKMTGAFGADAGAQKVFLAARTAAWDKTLYDPHVNLLRVTTQALSAVVGGADAIDFVPMMRSPATDRAGRHACRATSTPSLPRSFRSSTRSIPPAAPGMWKCSPGSSPARPGRSSRRWRSTAAWRRPCSPVIPQPLVAKAAGDKQTLVDTRRRPILGTTVQPNLREEPRPAPGRRQPASPGASPCPNPSRVSPPFGPRPEAHHAAHAAHRLDAETRVRSDRGRPQAVPRRRGLRSRAPRRGRFSHPHRQTGPGFPRQDGSAEAAQGAGRFLRGLLCHRRLRDRRPEELHHRGGGG